VPSPQAPPSPASRGRTILLIEDDRATHNALRALFTRRGWEVTVVTTIAEALPRLDGTWPDPPPDVVILDLMLPDGDGTAILRHVVAAALPTRMIVTTGSNDPARLAAVEKLHPDALLRKPIDLPTLLRHLDPAG
jgi:CheY-like chemotaxis protein